jgi:tetratricopeptide (TPR) repeat protein
LEELARVLEAKTDYTESEPLHREALAMRRKLLGEEHPDVAGSLNNLAVCLDLQNRHAEAMSLFEQAHAIDQRVYPSDHPRLVLDLNNIARCLQSLRRHREALPLYEQAVSMAERLYPGDHPYGAMALHHLGDARRATGDLPGALRDAEASIAAYRRHPDWNPVEQVHALEVLARVYADADRREEAVALRREAVDAHMNRQVPATDAHLTEDMLDLGAALLGAQQFAEAEPVLRDALSRARDVWGDGHNRVAFAQQHLADALRALGRLEEAEQLAREAVAMYLTLGDEFIHPHAHAVGVFANTLAAAGRLDQASSVQREFLASYSDALPPEDRSHHVAPLALHSLERKEYVEAERLIRELVAFNERNLGKDDPRVAQSLGPLGLLLVQTGRYAEAEPILRKCLALRETQLPPDSPEYWLVFNTRSLLGHSVLGQAEAHLVTERSAALARLREAEPLIVESCEWLTATNRSIKYIAF